MKQHLATLFGWRQPRHLPAQLMQLHVKLLMSDGTVTPLDVQIPETTPLTDIIRAVAIQLFAEHDITGEVACIGEISLHASTSPLAHGIPHTMATQGRTLRSI